MVMLTVKDILDLYSKSLKSTKYKDKIDALAERFEVISNIITDIRYSNIAKDEQVKKELLKDIELIERQLNKLKLQIYGVETTEVNNE